jgi:hypothetical protein
LVGVAALPSDPPKLGGYSGMELGPDGRQMVLISDRGRILRGQLERHHDDLHATTGPAISLQDRNLRRLNGRANDAEGIALGPDGTVFISFEGIHGLRAYAPGQMRALPLPRHADFHKMPGNGGLEALAIDHHGTVFAIPERSWARRGRLALYRYQQNSWTRWANYPRKPGFLPVGADFGPDGRLYVLERHFKGFGFASLVRSFAVTPQGPADPQILLQTPERYHGNLEGLAVWRDETGQIRLTMVADDNFLSLLPNEIVEYVLPKTLAKQGNQD